MPLRADVEAGPWRGVVLSVGRGAEDAGPTSGPRAGHAGCALSPCRHQEMERGDSQGPARQHRLPIPPQALSTESQNQSWSRVGTHCYNCD